MKKLSKLSSTIAIIAVLGASIGGYAAFATANTTTPSTTPGTSQQQDQNGFEGFGGLGRHGGPGGPGGHHGGRGGHGGHGGHGGPGGQEMMDGKFDGGRGDHGGMIGIGGPGGGVHQQKYLQLLVNAYAPELKTDADALIKAEKEFKTQMDALRTSGARPDPSKLTQPDQTTIDAEKAAHDKLTTAITADKTSDIAAALKDVIAAEKQELVLKVKHLKEMQAAQATTPTPTTSPAVSGSGV